MTECHSSNWNWTLWLCCFAQLCCPTVDILAACNSRYLGSIGILDILAACNSRYLGSIGILDILAACNSRYLGSIGILDIRAVSNVTIEQNESTTKSSPQDPAFCCVSYIHKLSCINAQTSIGTCCIGCRVFLSCGWNGFVKVKLNPFKLT